jgi:hypothetical protein
MRTAEFDKVGLSKSGDFWVKQLDAGQRKEVERVADVLSVVKYNDLDTAKISLSGGVETYLDNVPPGIDGAYPLLENDRGTSAYAARAVSLFAPFAHADEVRCSTEPVSYYARVSSSIGAFKRACVAAAGVQTWSQDSALLAVRNDFEGYPVYLSEHERIWGDKGDVAPEIGSAVKVGEIPGKTIRFYGPGNDLWWRNAEVAGYLDKNPLKFGKQVLSNTFETFVFTGGIIRPENATDLQVWQDLDMNIYTLSPSVWQSIFGSAKPDTLNDDQALGRFSPLDVFMQLRFGIRTMLIRYSGKDPLTFNRLKQFAYNERPAGLWVFPFATNQRD